MDKKRLILILMVVFYPSAIFAENNEVQTKLDKLAKELVSGYDTSPQGVEKPPLAVLPFHTDKKLAKVRTGTALAELLTHSFHRSGKFRMLERIELGKILAELKLSMSGIISTDDAVQVGRLVGAKLQVFGSMEKIGGRYHINARVVETETGQILATAYETLPADLFEEEAKPYLVPGGNQTVGFYWLYNERRVPTVAQPVTRSTYGGNTQTIYPRSATMYQSGGGVRYNPTKRMQLDLAGIYSSKTDNSGGTVVQTMLPFSPFNFNLSFGVITYRFLVDFDLLSTKSLHFYTGGGFITHQLYKNMHGSYSSPLLHARLEYRPQIRVALGIAINYELKKTSWRAGAGESESNFSPYTKSHMPRQLTIEPTIGLYF